MVEVGVRGAGGILVIVSLIIVIIIVILSFFQPDEYCNKSN